MQENVYSISAKAIRHAVKYIRLNERPVTAQDALKLMEMQACVLDELDAHERAEKLGNFAKYVRENLIDEFTESIIIGRGTNSEGPRGFLKAKPSLCVSNLTTNAMDPAQDVKCGQPIEYVRALPDPVDAAFNQPDCWHHIDRSIDEHHAPEVYVP